MIGSIPLACRPIDTLSWQLGVTVVILSVKGILLSRVNLNIIMFEALLLDTTISLDLSPTFKVTIPLNRGSLISVKLILTLALTLLLPLYTAM